MEDIGLGYAITGFARGSAALSRCATAHPLHTRFAEIIGTSFFETTMPPDPRFAGGFNGDQNRAASILRGLAQTPAMVGGPCFQFERRDSHIRTFPHRSLPAPIPELTQERCAWLANFVALFNKNCAGLAKIVGQL